ncbi:MAG: histidinol-phosphatase HisJ [Peptococcaceae bacterium]
MPDYHLPDYHIHTWLCGHAAGQMEEYITAARQKDITEIGFADHIPMYWLLPEQRDFSLAMQEKELAFYLAEINRLQAKNQDLILKVGLEVDYIPGREKELAHFLSKYTFDYLIGSVHYLNGWGFDQATQQAAYAGKDPVAVYRQYFDLLKEAALSGFFDIMAHPDLIKKFNYRLTEEPISLYLEAAKAFAQAGVCVEVNTAGLRVPAGEIYPSLSFLKVCRQCGVPAAVGSDAHQPGQVGYGFKEAVRHLRRAGYHEVALYSGRYRYSHSIVNFKR